MMSATFEQAIAKMKNRSPEQRHALAVELLKGTKWVTEDTSTLEYENAYSLSINGVREGEYTHRYYMIWKPAETPNPSEIPNSSKLEAQYQALKRQVEGMPKSLREYLKNEVRRVIDE